MNAPPRLYEPDSAPLLSQLPDTADGFAARLHQLHRTPDAGLADQVARDAAGIYSVAVRIAAALRQEQAEERGHGQCVRA